MIKLAPSLLLSILCANESAAFNVNVVRSTLAPRSRSTALPASNNDFDSQYDVDISASELSRRNALARFAAAAVTGASFIGATPAFAADKETEFSESPTSDAAIGRAGYDGKLPPPAPAPAPAAPVAVAAPVAKKQGEDFDGNEAGSVGATDEGSQPNVLKKFDPKVALAGINSNIEVMNKVRLGDVPPGYLVGGSVAITVATVALAGGGDDEEGGAAPAPVPSSAPAPPAPAYGMAAGRNYWDGVDMNAAKIAGLVAPAPVKAVAAPVAPAPPAPKKLVEVEEEEEAPSWKLKPPTPYGIENAGGKNPFIKNVEQYCKGGKVTKDCTETIKGYLDDISDTGAAASSSEVKAIVGYLGSLGSDNTSTPSGKKAGAAFTSYLDALAEGSAPPPSSAKAVKTYLDTLNGDEAAPKSPAKAMASPVAEAAAPAAPEPEPVVEAAPRTVAIPEWEAEFAAYDTRLTGIEGRVTSLETKVDEIPDKVFEKIEAWQSAQEERLSADVKRIVEALTPPPAPAAPAVVEATPVPEPVAEVYVPEPEPEPVVIAEPAAPAVPATPLGAAIPLRPSMPQAGPSSGTPKKYGFGGGSSWKNAAPPAAVEAVVVPEPAAVVPEPVVVSEPVAPPVPATPLAGAVPARPSMPQAGPSSGAPKKYGFGGGASWKNMSP